MVLVGHGGKVGEGQTTVHFFPTRLKKREMIRDRCIEDQEPHTFSMYPQEGASGFPLVEYITLKKPLSCTVVTSLACKVMICG
jgi:hypothetical protein